MLISVDFIAHQIGILSRHFIASVTATRRILSNQAGHFKMMGGQSFRAQTLKAARHQSSNLLSTSFATPITPQPLYGSISQTGANMNH